MASKEIDLEIERALNINKPKSNLWKKGPKITKQDLRKAIENGGELAMGDIVNDFSLTNTLGFGKYRDKTYKWVLENDQRYYYWACENIRGFKEKAKQALQK